MRNEEILIRRRIGGNIRYLRITDELTQKQFADKFGLNVSDVTNIELGCKPIAYSFLLKLSETYEVTLDFLIKENHAPAEVLIGERIYKAREKLGLTLKGLAEKLDCNYSTISNWESGKREPSIYDIAKLSQILGVSTDYLLKGKGEK